MFPLDLIVLSNHYRDKNLPGKFGAEAISSSTLGFFLLGFGTILGLSVKAHFLLFLYFLCLSQAIGYLIVHKIYYKKRHHAYQRQGRLYRLIQQPKFNFLRHPIWSFSISLLLWLTSIGFGAFGI